VNASVVSLLEVGLLVLHIVDLAFALSLALVRSDFDVSAFVRAELFSTGAADLMWLSVVRFLVVPGTVLWRARVARRARALSEALARRTVYDDETKQAASSVAVVNSTAGTAAASSAGRSLSINGNDDDASSGGARTEVVPLLLSDKAAMKERRNARRAAQKATLERARQQIDFDRLMSRATRSLHFANYAVLVLLFVFLTGNLVFVGIKSVLFEFSNFGSVQYFFETTALASSLVFMTSELWVARDVLEAASKDNGRLIPSLHLHGLFLDENMAVPRCDICRERIRERVAYRCRACNFDVCLACFKAHARKQQEDVLRGEHGVRQDEELSNWRYVRRTMLYLKPYWPYVVTALFLLFCRSLSQIFLPNFQGKILDRVIAGDAAGFETNLYYYIGLTISVTVLSSVQSFFFSIVSRKMANLLKDDLFSAMVVQDVAFFDATAVGSLTSRLSGDVNAMISPVQSALAATVSSGLQLVGGLILCIHTSFRLSMLALTVIGPIVLIFRIYAQWSKGINKQIWASWSDANARATEALKNIRTVRAFSMEPDEISAFKGFTKQALANGTKDAIAGMLTSILSNTVDSGVSVLLLAYGGRIVLESHSNPDMSTSVDGGQLTIGALITFQLYWNMVNNAYSNISSVMSDFTRAGGAAQRVISLLDSLPDIDVHAGIKIARANFRGALELRDVHFTYQMRPEEPILKGINLKIEAGKTLALVGRSGGGKSTIIHLLLRFYDPTSGQVLVDGNDLRQMCALDYRRHVGVVTQETQLFRGTIGDNIAYGAEAYTQDDVIAAAKEANAFAFIDAMEEKFATFVGENGVRLSGGQRQRIALARAMMRKPQILLLDEATSALDTESETLVQAAIDKMLADRQCTVVLVAHRLSTVMAADVIAVIDKGRIVEQGTHGELLELGGIYAKLVGKQLQKEANLINADERMALKQSREMTIDALLDDDDAAKKASAKKGEHGDDDNDDDDADDKRAPGGAAKKPAVKRDRR
jgi:ABC-type multidrug transport system fused ATPase/permease subunit